MFGLSSLPKSEVGLVLLFAHSGKIAAGVFHVFEATSGEDAVLVHFVVFLHIEIDGTVTLIGKAVIENLFDELLLLDDVPRSVRLDAGGDS